MPLAAPVMRATLPSSLIGTVPSLGLTLRCPSRSLADENRHRAVCQNTCRVAAKDEARDPAPAVRRHDDQIATPVARGLQDTLGRIFLDVYRRALNTQFPCQPASGSQSLRRLACGCIFVGIEGNADRSMARAGYCPGL